MPYTPLRKLKPEGLKNEFVDAFNFDDLSSDDEVPAQQGHNRNQYVALPY